MELIPTDSPDTSEIYIYNPTNESFTHSWLGVPYTIPSGEGIKLPKETADHLAKHLITLIVGKQSGVQTEQIAWDVLSDALLDE